MSDRIAETTGQHPQTGTFARTNKDCIDRTDEARRVATLIRFGECVLRHAKRRLQELVDSFPR